MRSSRPVAIVAIILMFGFIAPMLCVGFATTGFPSADTMPGGCHDHHAPMPSPEHSCCYAAHQIPVATSIVPTSMPLTSVVEWIGTSIDRALLNDSPLAAYANDSFSARPSRSSYLISVPFSSPLRARNFVSSNLRSIAA